MDNVDIISNRVYEGGEYMGQELNVVMYHYVRDFADTKYPNIRGLDIKLFEQQLDFIQQNYTVITMEQLLEAIQEDNINNLPENAMLLTFDDGYIDHYKYVMPVLKKRGMQGSFFIPAKTFNESKVLDVNKIHHILAVTNEDVLLKDILLKLDLYRGKEFKYPSNEELLKRYAVASRFDSRETIFIKRILQTVLPEKLRSIIADELFEKKLGIDEISFSKGFYMNKEQLNEMKQNGMFIGIHGYDHYWLGNLSEELMKRDIDKALLTMKEYINPEAWVMNYPYGSYNQKVIEYISSKGCKVAFCTEVAIARGDFTEIKYSIPRLDTNDFPPKSEKYKEM